MNSTIATRTSSTGRQLETGRAEAFGLDPEGQRWITCCTDHATLVGCSTKALALSSDSIDFCEECRAESDRKAPATVEVDELVWIGRGDVTYRVVAVHEAGTVTLQARNAVGSKRGMLRTIEASRLTRQGRKA